MLGQLNKVAMDIIGKVGKSLEMLGVRNRNFSLISLHVIYLFVNSQNAGSLVMQ